MEVKRQSSSEHNFVELCEAWLRPLPNPNLGLTIPPHEFVIAIRTLLGILMFPLPTSVLCCCGATIDPFGDSLISCPRGPLCVQRHNALCEVIFQALLVENKQVKQQNCSGYNSSRPGDVNHPDFIDGRPGYFDVTIRNSLQPSFILKAAISPDAAAEAAECEKSEKRHAANVTTAGGLFCPLVFESRELHIIFHSKDFERNMFKDIINQWDNVSSTFQEHIRTVVCKTMVLQCQDVTCTYAIRSFRCL